MGSHVSNLVHGVLNGVELDFAYNFFTSCSVAEISWAKVQYADVGLQPEISQQWSKIDSNSVQFNNGKEALASECLGQTLKHVMFK